MNNADFQPSEAARNAQEYMAKLGRPPKTNEEIITLLLLGSRLVDEILSQWDSGIAFLAEKRTIPLAA